MEDGNYMWTTITDFVDVHNMAAWGRIALAMEHPRISQALLSLRRYLEDARLAGSHVDGIFSRCHTLYAPRVFDEILEEHRLEDGSPVAHIKRDEPVSAPPHNGNRNR